MTHQDTYFECIFESASIAVPSLEVITHYGLGTHRWHRDLVNIDSAQQYRLIEGTHKKIKIVRLLQQLPSLRCLEFLRDQKPACANIHSLMVAQMLFEPVLPIDTVLLGFDEQYRLSKDPVGEHRIPYLYLYLKGKLKIYNWKGMHGDWGRGFCLVYLCD